MADGIKEREEFHFNMEALPSDLKEPLKIDIEKTPMRKIINNTSKNPNTKTDTNAITNISRTRAAATTTAFAPARDGFPGSG